MKSAADPNRLTRVQVQEKLKKNVQALCNKCPQLVNNYEVLDDSLTSLHWLSNLNVNIGNPTKDSGKNGSIQPNQGFLPSFPHAAMRNVPHHLQGECPPQNVSGQINYARRNWNGNSTTKQRTGSSRKSSAKVERNASAPTLGRPTPQVQADTGERMHSASVISSKMLVRGLPINPPMPRPLPNSNRNDLGTSAVTGQAWRYDVIDSKLVGTQIQTRNAVEMAYLPQIISTVNPNQQLIVNGVAEPQQSVGSPTSHYTFSPREVMLDLLPGQVDYKNNPYEKPNFTYTTLICMALQSHKKHKMSYSSICKWISDNFMYYRYADPGWQSSVKLNLTQSNYFTKVSKKEGSSKSYLWEINPASKIKLKDPSAAMLLDNLRRKDPRLGPVQISPVSSFSLPSVTTLPKFETEEIPTFANRKRKQTTPQKTVRRRSESAKKRRNNTKSAGNRNLLQEEAPELGSLKGEFNWNTIFDEFFGSTEAAISVTPTSLASRPSTNESRGTTGQSTEELTANTLLSLDMLSLPDLPEPSQSDENNTTTSSTNASLTKTSQSPSWPLAGKNDPHAKRESNGVNEVTNPQAVDRELSLLEDFDLLFPRTGNDSDLESISGFLKNVDDLDLTITGTQIAPPADWIPVSPDLEAILCETQNGDFIHPASTAEVENLLLTPSPPTDPEQYLSTTSSNKRRKPKTKKVNLNQSNSSTPEPTKTASKRQSNWQQQTFATKVY